MKREYVKWEDLTGNQKEEAQKTYKFCGGDVRDMPELRYVVDNGKVIGIRNDYAFSSILPVH